MIMPDNIHFYTGVYLTAVSLLSIGMTLYDKQAARSGAWRVKESSLLLVSIAGGSVAMFAVMRLIRHKTNRAKFMVGIPVIILLQMAAALLAWWRLNGGTP